MQGREGMVVFATSDRVMARWREGAQREYPDWYPGEVIRANGDSNT